MAVFSKLRYTIVDDLPCTVLHPWTNSCSYNVFSTYLQTFKGSTKFFLVIYLFQHLLKQRVYNHQVLTQQLFNFCRSCTFGAFCGGTSVAVMCFLRWCLGKYTPYSLGFIPGFIGGGGIFFEVPSRRGIDLTLFISLVINLYIKVFEDEGLLTISLTKELLFFMTCSSLLLYCLRCIHGSYTLLWPFTPHKLPVDPERRKYCPHKGACLDDIKKTSSAFFCYGLMLQSLKVAVFHFPKLFFKPISFLKAFFKLNNLRLPLFAGLYVLLFKGVSCLLREYRGQDEAWHALPAGAIASFCYLIQPNLSLGLFAFSNLSQIVCREYRKKLDIPAWPWEEMGFMLCIGLLYHARAVFPECFPQYMFTIMDTVTDGRAKIVYGLVDKHLILRT